MGILPSGESNSGGRTDWRIHVKIREADPLGSKLIDMLCFYRSTKTGKVTIAHIINENNDDIRVMSTPCHKAEKGE